MAQQRRAIVGQDGREEFDRRYLALKDRVRPYRRGQRHRDDISRQRQRDRLAAVQRIGDAADVNAEIAKQQGALRGFGVAVRLHRQRAAPFPEPQPDDIQQLRHLAPRTAVRVGERDCLLWQGRKRTLQARRGQQMSAEPAGWRQRCGPLSRRRLEDQPGDLRHEPRSIGRFAKPRRAGDRRGPAGNRDVFGDGPGGHCRQRKCRYNRGHQDSAQHFRG